MGRQQGIGARRLSELDLQTVRQARARIVALVQREFTCPTACLHAHRGAATCLVYLPIDDIEPADGQVLVQSYLEVSDPSAEIVGAPLDVQEALGSGAR